MVKIGFALLLTVLRLTCVLQTPSHGQGDILPKCKEEESKLVGETCFHFYTSPVTWYQAKSNCESNGMTLAYVSSLDQTREILNGYTIKGRVWIGASDEVNEGEFIWVASNEIATELEQLWARGEPNNKQNDEGDEDCVGIYPSFYASDGHCSYNYSYLCMEQTCPYNLNVERVSADDVTLSWKPGFNGGPPQTFTVKYLDMMTNTSSVAGTVTVPRVDQTSSRVVEYSVGGLLMKTPYTMYIDASINNGKTQCTPLMVTIETTDDFIPKCKEKGSKLVGETCFQFNASPVTWYQAKLNCESNGMTLAYVNSVNQVKEIVKAHTIQNRVWIGASDEKKEGEFLWVASNEIATELSQLWSNGEPNNMQRDVGDEDCVNLFPSSYANDDLCIFNFSYLCMEQLCPYNLKVEPVSDDEVTLSWKPGFNGGPPQMFTVNYQDLMTNLSRVAGRVTVPRINQTSSAAVQFSITDVALKTPYEIQMDASIHNGKTSCPPLIFSNKTTAQTLPLKMGVRDITLAVIMPIIGIIIVAVLGAFIRHFIFKKGTTHGVLDTMPDNPLNAISGNTGYQYIELEESINTGHMGTYNQRESQEMAADNNTGAAGPNSQNKTPRLPPRPAAKSDDQHREEEQHSRMPLKLHQTANRSDPVETDKSKSTMLTLQLARTDTTSGDVEGAESEEYMIPLQLNLSNLNHAAETTFDNEFHQEDLNYDKDKNHDAENDQKDCEQNHRKQEDCEQEDCEQADFEQKDCAQEETMTLDSSSSSNTDIDEHLRKGGPDLESHMEGHLHHVEAPLYTNMEHRRGPCLEVNDYSSLGDTYIDHEYLRFGDYISHYGQVNTQASPAAISIKHGNDKTQNSDNDVHNNNTDTAGINISSLLSDSITTFDHDKNSYIIPVDSDENSYITPIDRVENSLITPIDRVENSYITPIDRVENSLITPIDRVENSYITPIDPDNNSLQNDDTYIVFDGAENSYITPVDSAATSSYFGKTEESHQSLHPLQLPRPHFNTNRQLISAETNFHNKVKTVDLHVDQAKNHNYITPIDRAENSYLTPIDRAATWSYFEEESDQNLIPLPLPGPHLNPSRHVFATKRKFEDEVQKNVVPKDKAKNVENAHDDCQTETNDFGTAESRIPSILIDYSAPIDLEDDSYITPIDSTANSLKNDENYFVFDGAENSYLTRSDRAVTGSHCVEIEESEQYLIPSQLPRPHLHRNRNDFSLKSSFDDEVRKNDTSIDKAKKHLEIAQDDCKAGNTNIDTADTNISSISHDYITPTDLDDNSYITPVDRKAHSYITHTERHENGSSDDESYIVFDGAGASHLTCVDSAVSRSYCDTTEHSEQYLTPLPLPRPHFNANRQTISLESSFHKIVQTEDLPIDQVKNHDYITPVEGAENSYITPIDPDDNGLKNDDFYIVFDGAEKSYITPVDSAATWSYSGKTEESDQHLNPLKLPRPHFKTNRQLISAEPNFHNKVKTVDLPVDQAKNHDYITPVEGAKNSFITPIDHDNSLKNDDIYIVFDGAENSYITPIDRAENSYITPIDRAENSYITPIDRAENSYITPIDRAKNSYNTPIDRAENSYITPIDPDDNGLKNEDFYIVFDGAENSNITPVDSAATWSYSGNTEESDQYLNPLQLPRPHVNSNRRLISAEPNFYNKVKTADLRIDQAKNNDYITPVDRDDNSLKNDDIYIVFDGAEDSYITPIDRADNSYITPIDHTENSYITPIDSDVTWSYFDKTQESDQYPIPLELPRPHLKPNKRIVSNESNFDNDVQKVDLHNDNAKYHDIENAHHDCKSTLSEEKFNLEPVLSSISRNKVGVIQCNESPSLNAPMTEYVDQEETSLASNIEQRSEPRPEIDNYPTNEDTNIDKHYVRYSNNVINCDQGDLQSSSSAIAARHGHKGTQKSDHCLENDTDTVDTNISSVLNEYLTPIDTPGNILGQGESYIVFDGAEDSHMTPVDRAVTRSHGDENEQSEENMIPLPLPRPHLNPNRKKYSP